MEEKLKCSLKYCTKHDKCKNKNQIHHFTLEDLKHEDLNFMNEVLNKKLTVYGKRSLEAEELKNLYQSAYIYQLLFDFAREHLPLLKGEEVVDQCEQKEVTDCDKIKEKILEFLFKTEIVTEKPVIKELEIKQQDNIENQLWDTNDLNVLRKVFASIKENNIQLNSRSMVLERENNELKEKLEALRNETKNLPNEKRTLAAENERLYVRIRNLEQEYKTFDSQLAACENEKKMLKERLDSERKTNQTLLNEKSMIEFELRKCENDLNAVRNELKLKQTLLIEKVSLKYQSN